MLDGLGDLCVCKWLVSVIAMRTRLMDVIFMSLFHNYLLVNSCYKYCIDNLPLQSSLFNSVPTRR